MKPTKLLTTSYTYIVKDRKDGYCKIGTSKNPVKRIEEASWYYKADLDIDNAIIIEAKNDSGYMVEQYLHRYFSKRRMAETEWFDLTDKDLESVRSDIHKILSALIPRVQMEWISILEGGVYGIRKDEIAIAPKTFWYCKVDERHLDEVKKNGIPAGSLLSPHIDDLIDSEYTYLLAVRFKSKKGRRRMRSLEVIPPENIIGAFHVYGGIEGDSTAKEQADFFDEVCVYNRERRTAWA